MARTDQRQHTELVPWRYVARYTRRGWMTRDFFKGNRRYHWLCNGLSAAGIVRYGLTDEEQSHTV